MAAYAYDGNVRFVWLEGEDAIDDIDAPTELELADGDDISCLLQKGGWSGSPTFNTVEAARACETFDSKVQGTWSVDPTGTFFRDDNPTLDIAWDLWEHGTNGYIVIRYGKAYDIAFEDGDEVEVWPVQSSEPVMNENAANTSATFQVSFAASQPQLKAVVGGGS